MKVGRFQVMATLQAARAKELGMPTSQAKSWGLNRAIFYAAAKRGFKKKKVAPRTRGEIERKPLERKKNTYFLGNEMAYCSKKGARTYFAIGGELQTENDFKRQISVRFGKVFPKAWKESVTIVRNYPKDTLLSQNRFFSEVYRPRRDELASKWTEMSGK